MVWKNFSPDYPHHPLFRAGPELESVAELSWEIAPGLESVSRGAYFLPNQLERVTGMAYTDDPLRDVAAGIQSFQAPTRGFLIKNAWLLDGSLYTRDKRFDLHARRRLQPWRRYVPRVRVDHELERGAIYSTIEGSEFFGLWLTDDCSTYPLARSEGIPLTSNQ